MTIVNYDWDEIEDNIVEEYDDAGATVAEYTTEPEKFGNVVSQRRSGQDSYYHYDGQGSTLSLTNGNCNVTDTYAYTAFGEPSGQTGSTDNALRFGGRIGYRVDTNVLEFDIRLRVLHAEQSRWLSIDESPVRMGIGVGAYHYARNNPNSYIDPSGRQEQPKLKKPDVLRITTEFTLVVTGQTKVEAECGQLVAKVKFTIDKAPCTGYLIQHITVKRHIQDCDPHEKCPGTFLKSDLEEDFYEMFPFNPPYGASRFPIDGKVEKVDDRVSQGGRAMQHKTGKPNCGKLSINGDVRFYCDVGDDDPDQWKPAGGGPSGDLKSKKDEPSFWKNDPAAKGSAFISHWWCCCAEPKIHSRDLFVEDSSGGKTIDVSR